MMLLSQRYTSNKMANKHPCPECNGSPTPESLAEQNLSDLGYLHDDRFLVCEDCDYQWTVGKPVGVYDGDEWVCGCGGDFIPHFMYIKGDTLEVRPKCQECYHVPDEPIERDILEMGNCKRIFISHHSVTGNVADADPHSDM